MKRAGGRDQTDITELWTHRSSCTHAACEFNSTSLTLSSSAVDFNAASVIILGWTPFGLCLNMLGVQSDALLVGLMVWMGILWGEISTQGNVHYCTDSFRCPFVFDALTLLFNRKSPGNFNNTLLTFITITHSLFEKDSLQHKYLSLVVLMRHVRFADKIVWDKHACFDQFGSCMRCQNCFQDKSGAEIMKKHAYVWICCIITRVDKEKRCGIPTECDFIIYHMYRCNA